MLALRQHPRRCLPRKLCGAESDAHSDQDRQQKLPSLLWIARVPIPHRVNERARVRRACASNGTPTVNDRASAANAPPSCRRGCKVGSGKPVLIKPTNSATTIAAVAIQGQPNAARRASRARINTTIAGTASRNHIATARSSHHLARTRSHLRGNRPRIPPGAAANCATRHQNRRCPRC